MNFWAVRFMAGIQIVIGTLIIFASILLALGAIGLLSPPPLVPLVGGDRVVLMIVAAAVFIVGAAIVAQGQLLMVFLQIERNTRHA